MRPERRSPARLVPHCGHIPSPFFTYRVGMSQMGARQHNFLFQP